MRLESKKAIATRRPPVGWSARSRKPLPLGPKPPVGEPAASPRWGDWLELMQQLGELAGPQENDEGDSESQESLDRWLDDGGAVWN